MKFATLAAFLATFAFSEALVARVDSRIPVVWPADLDLAAAQAKWTKYCVTDLQNDLGAPGDDTYTPYPYCEQAPDIYTTPALNVYCSAADGNTATYTDETIAWLGWERATYKD